MTSLLRQIALVSESSSVSFSDLTTVSAALQKQVARDLGPIWDVQATIDAFADVADVPPGYWLVAIVETDPRADASPTGGIHLDSSNQPFAVIKFVEHWSLVASHEILEMLVDPFGNRLVAGDSPNTNQGRVEFLVEVCDPSEAADFAYTCNGIVVSDFYTPNYFDPVQSPGVRYSFQGNITEPREVLKGGYLSWHDPTNDTWWQQTFFTGDAPVIVPLGRLEDGGASLRAQIDSKTEKRSHKAIMRRKSVLNRTKKAYQSQIVVPSTRNAQRWRKHIKKLGFKTK